MSMTKLSTAGVAKMIGCSAETVRRMIDVPGTEAVMSLGELTCPILSAGKRCHRFDADLVGVWIDKDGNRKAVQAWLDRRNSDDEVAA